MRHFIVNGLTCSAFNRVNVNLSYNGLPSSIPASIESLLILTYFDLASYSLLGSVDDIFKDISDKIMFRSVHFIHDIIIITTNINNSKERI
jgi:hypothetical protein